MQNRSITIKKSDQIADFENSSVKILFFKNDSFN